MKLIITDVTEMHGGNFCVAGWRAKTGRMVRPLPNGANWTQALLQQHGVTPGATISFRVLAVAHQGAYPHSTEDNVVDAAQIALVSPGPCSWFGANGPTVSPSIDAGFGGAVEHNSVWNGTYQGVYVPVGAQVSSLCAIVVPRAQLDFMEDFGKLKAIVDDGTDSYKLAVSSLHLKEAWRNGGVAAVRAAIPTSARLHVRVGLARGFGTPPKCYMMLNGVHG